MRGDDVFKQAKLCWSAYAPLSFSHVSFSTNFSIRWAAKSVSRKREGRRKGSARRGAAERIRRCADTQGAAHAERRAMLNPVPRALPLCLASPGLWISSEPRRALRRKGNARKEKTARDGMHACDIEWNVHSATRTSHRRASAAYWRRVRALKDGWRACRGAAASSIVAVWGTLPLLFRAAAALVALTWQGFVVAGDTCCRRRGVHFRYCFL